jgi:hypothetical protein
LGDGAPSSGPPSARSPDASLMEVSGIAASARHPGTLWMHND